MYVHKATPHRILSDDIAFNYDWEVTNAHHQQVAFIPKVEALVYPFLIKTDNTYVLISGFGKYIEMHYTKIFDFLDSDTHTDTIEMFEGMSIETVKKLFQDINAEPPAPQEVPNTWFYQPPQKPPVKSAKIKNVLFNDPLASLLKDLEAEASKPNYSWTVGKQGISFKQQAPKEHLPF